MSSSIEKILEYQSADREYMKLEKELKESEAAKQMAVYKNKQRQAATEMARLNTSAEELFGAVMHLHEHFEAVEREISELANTVDDTLDDKQLEYYQKRLEKADAALSSLEKDLLKAQKDLLDVQSRSAEELKNAQKATKGVVTYTDKVKQVKAELMPKVTELTDKMKELEKDIEPKNIEAYKRVKGMGKTPVFVKFIAPGSCGGCGMELSNEVIGRFNAGSSVEECPNCNRLVYNVAQQK